MTIWYVGADCYAIAYFQLRYVEAFCLYVYALCMIFVHVFQNRIFKIIEERQRERERATNKKNAEEEKKLQQKESKEAKIKINHDNKMYTHNEQRTVKGE